MSAPQGSPAQKVEAGFQKLSKTAGSLNSASDRLNVAVEHLNSALKKLNLGISSWYAFSMWEDGPFSEVQEIGYGKVNGKWGIGLRKMFEDKNNPEEEVTEWHFADAPREMRIHAIGHLHHLIDKLNEDADNAAKKLVIKTMEAEEFAKAINALADNASAQGEK